MQKPKSVEEIQRAISSWSQKWWNSNEALERWRSSTSDRDRRGKDAFAVWKSTQPSSPFARWDDEALELEIRLPKKAPWLESFAKWSSELVSESHWQLKSKDETAIWACPQQEDRLVTSWELPDVLYRVVPADDATWELHAGINVRESSPRIVLATSIEGARKLRDALQEERKCEYLILEAERAEFLPRTKLYEDTSGEDLVWTSSRIPPQAMRLPDESTGERKRPRRRIIQPR